MEQDNVIQFTKLSEELNKVISKQITVLGEAATNLDKLNTSYGKLPSEYVKSMKDALDIEKKQVQIRQALITEEQKKADLLAKTSRKEAAALRTKQVALRLSEQQARASKKETIENTKLLSAYNRLNDSLNKAEKNYRDLAVSLGRLDPKTKAARREVLKLRTQLDSINNPIKRWNSNVGNYASGLKGLAGALGWAGLTFAIVNGVKATFETIKAYDALIKSIEKVTISQQAASAEFSYVSDLSERYGINLRQTTKDYVNFLAAVKGTNLEGKKARDIFEKVSKSAASMGLSAEETSGTLRALNQIISKGKVQAEELRGQLGDRISGAFQIMARAIGVTTSELDEMLKKGEVIADEVLPKFAIEMEKAFGVENLNRTETLAAATERLSTAWDKFIISIDDGNGAISNFLKTTFNSWATALAGLSTLLEGNEGILKKTELDNYTKKTDELNNSNLKNVKIAKQLLDNNSKLLQQKQTELQLLNEFAPANKGQRKLKEKDISNLEKEIALIKGNNGALRDYHKSLLIEKNGLIDKLIIKDKTLKQGDLEKKTIKQLIALLDIYNSKTTEVSRPKNLRGVSDLKEAQTSYRIEVEKLIKDLTLLQSVERKGTKAYNELETSIKALKQTFEPLEISVKRANDEIQRGIDIDKQRARELAALQQATQQYMKSFQTDFFQGAGLGSLEQFFDGSFDELLKGSSDKWSVYFNAIAEVAQEAFNYISQVTQANFQNELNMLEKRKQAQLLFAGEGTAARERIEEQYEKRRAAIQKKQAEAQKKQAIFNALINTGQAVVSVLAQERGDAAKKLIAAAVVGGLGLAQVAFIASQKIPEFKDGVRNFEGGHAIVGDGGVSEIVRTSKGVYATPSTDTLVNLPAGADVFKNHDEYFNNVMGEMGVLPSMPKINVVNNGLTKVDLDSVMAKHFSNIQTNQTTIDKNGLNTYVKKQNSKTVSNNNRVTFKGFSV